MQRRVTSGLLALAAAAGLLTGAAPAGAGHTCANSKVVVFGYVAGATANPNSPKCLAEGLVPTSPTHAQDGRVLLPRSSEVSMRLAEDFGAATPTLDGRFFGPGFTNANRWITLTRQPHESGTGFVYNSPRRALPNGETTSGCITAEIVFNRGTVYEFVYDSNRFRTYDATCT